MPKLNLERSRDLLQRFEFTQIFVDELGWQQPVQRASSRIEVGGLAFSTRQIAHLAGIVVVEVTAESRLIPDARTRSAVWCEISRTHHENLVIFVDGAGTQSLWYWVKRDGGKTYPREHYYIKGQPGDLFLSKLSAMVVDISEFDKEGNVPLTTAARRLQDALDQERVTKKFYQEFKDEHQKILDQIDGIGDDRDRRWYASVLLNRLMFVYFLQGKGFIDDRSYDYLQEKLEVSRQVGVDHYYRGFLLNLFFEGFAKPDSERTPEALAQLGKIRYLNGGIFLKHPVEQRWPDIDVPDKAFDGLYALFGRYTWNLNDTPGGDDNEINPDVLGYIFEKHINQKEFGAYYTRPEITDYLCEQTIHRLVLDKINEHDGTTAKGAKFESMGDLLMSLDAQLCHALIEDVLPKLSLLDPACGSGAFLVAAMKTLINIYSAVTWKIEYLTDAWLTKWLKDVRAAHPSLNYYIKKRIITDNLFGVDIMEESTEIAKLRLFLALVASAQGVDDLEPLPNIDFNILPGNSLIGLMHVDNADFNKRDAQLGLFHRSYAEIVAEKDRLVAAFRTTTRYSDNLQSLRDEIRVKKEEAAETLNEILLAEFKSHGIKFEEATWDDSKGAAGKPTKRSLELSDIEALHPFHWGYEFDDILNKRGGFDAIITNPPWEIFKPNGKEFFQRHSDIITKNKMTIQEFEEAQSVMLRNRDVRSAWLAYQSEYPHQSSFYRSAKQYENQISVVNGKKAGTDINLYRLFTEQCYNLIRQSGYCGIVIPSGIYTDLGTKQLRKLLFSSTRITGLFGFENRRAVFEGVDSRFKFVVLGFEKGGHTLHFPTAFMRHEVAELKYFPRQGALNLTVDLVTRLSPDSLSIMEFKNELEIRIAKKMSALPALSAKLAETWGLSLAREFDMTNDSKLFLTSQGPNSVELYEGKMIHQFQCGYASARYWIDEAVGRQALTKSGLAVPSDIVNYVDYRFGIRAIARNTDKRTLIVGPLPKATFCGNSILAANVLHSGGTSRKRVAGLYLQAVLNSLALDSYLRQMVSANINMFYIYQLPVPRLTERDAAFAPIVSRAARLICTTPEFDDLAREVGLHGHEDGATDPAERAKLRAELDGLVAQLYGLTAEEFAHILTTFPLVDQAVKDAAMAEFLALEAQAELAASDPLAAETVALIAAGESDSVEFKRTLEFIDDADLPNVPNLQQVKSEKQKAVVHSSLKTVAAFLNTDGGTLLIGVHDDGHAVGIEPDLRSVKHRNTDGFELKLREMLKTRFNPKPLTQVKVRFPTIDGLTVCRVDVEKADDICHLDDKVYVRHGNTTQELSGPTLTHWIAGRMLRPTFPLRGPLPATGG